MSSIRTIAVFSLQEALRRRVFVVVAGLSVAFLALYGLGIWQAFKATDASFSEFEAVDAEVVTGGTMLGLSMFATLFLGTTLAVFLTLGAVRGEAERGLLQPLLVRPIARRDLLLARFAAAAVVCGLYVLCLYLACVLITGLVGGWWPDRILRPGLTLVAGVTILAALSLAGSVVLASAANGIAVFMTFGAGLVAGLLGEIGEAFGSKSLTTVSDVTTWALPFEALYQAGLADLTADTSGLTGFALQLGPFGSADRAGIELWLFSAAYLGAVGALAIRAFERRDL
jgi:ABC-type transport system involved in multi-copper enzyme maturation permease subunit